MKSNDSTDSENNDYEYDQVKQLLALNEQLQDQLNATQRQLASSMELHAALLQQQSGDALVFFGEGTQRHYLNARTIRLLTLKEGMQLGSYEQAAGPSNTFAVMVDELQVGDYLPPEEAQQSLYEVAALVNRVLKPQPRPGGN